MQGTTVQLVQLLSLFAVTAISAKQALHRRLPARLEKFSIRKTVQRMLAQVVKQITTADSAVCKTLKLPFAETDSSANKVLWLSCPRRAKVASFVQLL